MPERRENCKKTKQSVILTTIECRKEEKIKKTQIISKTNHNRMPERRENFKNKIVSNTNNNRMPERRENCKKTNNQ